MAIFKCKMCGGSIEFEQGVAVGVCGSCGTKQTLPRLDDERRANLYDIANHFRRSNEFDKAAGIYEQVPTEGQGLLVAYFVPLQSLGTSRLNSPNLLPTFFGLVPLQLLSESERSDFS